MIWAYKKKCALAFVELRWTIEIRRSPTYQVRHLWIANRVEQASDSYIFHNPTNWLKRMLSTGCTMHTAWIHMGRRVSPQEYKVERVKGGGACHLRDIQPRQHGVVIQLWPSGRLNDISVPQMYFYCFCSQFSLSWAPLPDGFMLRNYLNNYWLVK